MYEIFLNFIVSSLSFMLLLAYVCLLPPNTDETILARKIERYRAYTVSP